MDANAVRERARSMRVAIIEMLAAAGSGHPGGSLSATDILAVLYFDKIVISKDDIKKIEEALK